MSIALLAFVGGGHSQNNPNGSNDNNVDPEVITSYATAELMFAWSILILAIVATYLLQRARLTWFPPSAAAIIIGMVAGAVFAPAFKRPEGDGLRFQPVTFWFVILPPIIFAAGFNLKRRDFFRNFLPCFLFAVVGTALTAITFGYLTYLLVQAGFIKRAHMGYNVLIECMMYGSLIAATDPVATLSVLSDIKVPRLLYNLIFGESVLNDPISIELFSTFKKYAAAPDDTSVTVWGITGEFAAICILSITIGAGISMAAAAVLYHSQLGHQRAGPAFDGSLYEVSIVTMTAYLSYLVADFLELSGIFAVFFSGVVHSHYSYHNISKPAQLALKKLIDLGATLSETFMFAYLGLQVFSLKHVIDWGLIWSGIPLCLLSRAINIFPISLVVNSFRSRPVPFRVQTFQFWCGLRGAVAYALSLNMPLFEQDPSKPGHRHMAYQTNPAVETATLFIVLSTTLLFGTLSGPLLRALGLYDKSDYEIGAAAPPHLLSARPRRHSAGSRRAASAYGSFDEDEDEEDDDDFRSAVDDLPSASRSALSSGGVPGSRLDPEPGLTPAGAGAAGHLNPNLLASAALAAAASSGRPRHQGHVIHGPGGYSVDEHGGLLYNGGLEGPRRKLSLHALWKYADEAYLKPLFGGRGRAARIGRGAGVGPWPDVRAAQHRSGLVSPLLLGRRSGSPDPFGIQWHTPGTHLRDSDAPATSVPTPPEFKRFKEAGAGAAAAAEREGRAFQGIRRVNFGEGTGNGSNGDLSGAHDAAAADGAVNGAAANGAGEGGK